MQCSETTESEIQIPLGSKLFRNTRRPRGRFKGTMPDIYHAMIQVHRSIYTKYGKQEFDDIVSYLKLATTSHGSPTDYI